MTGMNYRVASLLILCFFTWWNPASSAGNDLLGVNQALGILPASPETAQEVAPDAPVSAPYNDTRSEQVRPQGYDYGRVSNSDVFGAQLFTGAFSRGGASAFNPDYVIAIGDKVHVRLWGAAQFDGTVTVDPKGNIFLPTVGPVKLAGVQSRDIQKTVSAAVRRVYQRNVLSYASLEAAQPVRVFVSGFVRRPGLYDGTSMDSLLHYLDQAGGIDPERGSFLEVQVKRGQQVRERVNLYTFLLEGVMPLVQLADGDVIFVPPRKHMIRAVGLVENPNRFEFAVSRIPLSRLMELAKPWAAATHVRVVRNTGTIRNVEYYPLSQAPDVYLNDGDEVEFVADKKPGTITVRVEGEHLSPQEYVLPYGSRLGDLMQQIQFSNRSDTDSLQLFRKSVRERQKSMLNNTLRALENAVLTARSGTSDEARLRKEEAALILQWVDRARKVEPLGQVVISRKAERDQLLLENGDIIRVPTRDGLVVVSGEVLFPTAMAYSDEYSLNDYIEAAGGYAQNADASRVVLAHRDGTFEEVGVSRAVSILEFDIASESKVREGDQILVLPKVDVKSRQIVKDLSQILYQIAISAKVVLGL